MDSRTRVTPWMNCGAFSRRGPKRGVIHKCSRGFQLRRTLQQRVHVARDVAVGACAAPRSCGRRAGRSCGRGRRRLRRSPAGYSWVSSLASAIATWRGRATLRRALLRVHLRDLDLVVVGDGLLDVLDRDLAVLHREQVAQRLAAELDRELLAVRSARRRARASAPPSSSRTFDWMCLAMKNATCSSSLTRFGLGLLEQDRDAHLELGRLDRDGEPPAEARDQPVLDARRSPSG